MQNIQLYLIVILIVVIVFFVIDAVKYYKSQKRKIKNLHRFAKNGEKEAQRKLAKYYENGDNMVMKNKNKAAYWYQNAAFLGDKLAKKELKKYLDLHRRFIK